MSNNFIFDIDGTLVNLHPLWERVFREAYLQKVNTSLTPAELKGMFGPPALDSHRIVLQGRGLYTPERAEEMLAAAEGTMLGIIRSNDIKDKVLPGVPESLQHCREKNYGAACATGNLESIALAILHSTGLQSYFSVISTTTPTTSQRSEIVAAAREQLQRQGYTGTSENTYVIGDTPSDIKAARALSLPVIAVATGDYSLEELTEHQPDLLWPDLTLFTKHF